MFKIVDDHDERQWTPEHGYTISSPCEPDGSGELIKKKKNCQEFSAEFIFISAAEKCSVL